ncbi:alkaline phosphatase D family protein [Streptomyces sp. NBC_00873]|uniref:alkaline phosphatase D family protein n=1 Tax=unclassified Streptomyces TaxID=2593676 RepID=UPI00386F920C|nr:alkaline phosphatase D family protein [Streptomyces sp. NBC_00873]WTA42225.1 alkaline phosphatase D family protein [Streptomyces sp. NBC_00842]
MGTVVEISSLGTAWSRLGPTPPPASLKRKRTLTMSDQSSAHSTPAEANRRKFLMLSGAAAVATVVGGAVPAVAATETVGRFSSYPFALGVASGDPLADSVILWTRLAPEPLVIGSGMPQQKFAVHWQVADDEKFSQIVREGETFALPEHNHSVHVDVQGLTPDRWYYYRFRCGSELSPVGRTRTLPAPGAHVEKFSISHVSCQNWATGYFTPLEYMAEDDLDLAFHLGDYIYEGAITAAAPRNGAPITDEIRAQCKTLDQYRLRYSIYKTDKGLQAAHAAYPWAIVCDDHEVSNDYAGGTNQWPSQLDRRAAGYKAWWENIPTRLPAPVGPEMRIYRRFAVGDLVQFDMLDSRQYRIADNDPVVSRIGDVQEKWLLDGIKAYDTTWNFLAQGQQLGGVTTNSPTRNRIYKTYYDQNVSPIILSGDMHWTIAQDSLLEIPRADSPIVGSEFIVTSVTSTGDGPGSQSTKDGWLKNPWVKYVDGYRGYIRSVITPQGVSSTQRDVQYITRPNAPIWDAQNFYIEAGKPGIQIA